MVLPYAPFPKYGPGIIGQTSYDAELKAWELYQASLRNPAVDADYELTDVDEDNPGEALDKYTYLRKYVMQGQTRKRIFREQNIMATDKDHALRQGRDAMRAELAPRFNEANAEIWHPVPGTEKAVKPRGRAFEEGEDERRNEEGANGTAESEDAGAPNEPSGMPEDDTPGQEQEQGSGGDGGDGGEGGEGGEWSEASQGDSNNGQSDPDDDDQSPQGDGEGGSGDSEDGQDDTPRMPTCPECGEQRGSTEGCCASEKPGEMPKPSQPPLEKMNLQLLRTDGDAPYMGHGATDKLNRVARPEIVATITKSLGDVDTWSRDLVKHDVQVLATEIYAAMAMSHTTLENRISRINATGNLPGMRAQAQQIVDEALSKFEPPAGSTSSVSMQEAREIARKVLDQNMLNNIEPIAELVAEKLNAPRRIEVSMNGKVNEVSGTPHKIYDDCVAAMTRGLNVFLCGPAGSGKGFLAQHLAEGLGARFGFLSCSEGMSEGMILGRGVPLANEFLYLQSSFVDFYENGGVFMLDEIDAANPNVLLIINECLSSPHLSIPNRVDDPYAKRHKDFHCIVAANTWGTGPDMEYVGRNRLDAAFLDRFIGSKFELEYDARIEGEIAKAYMGPKKAPDVLKRFWGVRKKLVELNIRRIWSTRGLEKMCIALAAGDDMSKVLDAHTTGWTRDEKSKAGVSA